ncbi:MAG: inositol monophosphatase [Candidatus Aenigmarchaeota archaeon]|nr:inositol monophosphatase [Candidatus Aenigmarchaeota archaeon]
MARYRQFTQRYGITQTDLLAGLKQAALAGGNIITNANYENLGYSRKTDGEPTTDVDAASERAIVDILRLHLPRISIYSEENDYEQYGRLWALVDPLDGTKNLVGGTNIDRVSVSIIVFYRDDKIAAVVYAPFKKKMYYALRGEGSWLDGSMVSVSEGNDLVGGRINFNSPRDRNDALLTEQIRGVLPTNPDRGSPSLDIAEVGSGEVDAFFKVSYKPHDVGAALIVEEAGGIVTDTRGNPLTFSKDTTRVRNPYGILACNRHLHGPLVEIMKMFR